MNETLFRVERVIHQLEPDRISTAVQDCLDAGIDPLTIIKNGITKGLERVGRDFESGTCFLGELMLAGQTATEGMAILEKVIPSHRMGESGKVVLATVEGDIHEIGKNILAMLLKAGGFDVIDLGVDVPAHSILGAVMESGANLVGLSLLFSSVTHSLKETVQLISGRTKAVKIMIGGACTSEQLRKEIGAHGYAESAVQGVKLFQEWAQL